MAHSTYHNFSSFWQVLILLIILWQISAAGSFFLYFNLGLQGEIESAFKWLQEELAFVKSINKLIYNFKVEHRWPVIAYWAAVEKKKLGHNLFAELQRKMIYLLKGRIKKGS